MSQHADFRTEIALAVVKAALKAKNHEKKVPDYEFSPSGLMGISNLPVEDFVSVFAVAMKQETGGKNSFEETRDRRVLCSNSGSQALLALAQTGELKDETKRIFIVFYLGFVVFYRAETLGIS